MVNCWVASFCATTSDRRPPPCSRNFAALVCGQWCLLATAPKPQKKQEKKLPVMFIQDLLSKLPIPLPIPDVSVLNPPLGAVPLLAKNIEFVTDSAKRTPIQAVLHGMARAAASADGVTATGTLDVLRYGQPLRARALVGVRGAGAAFDGLHFVRRVTHRIKRGEYKQEFRLSRNGLLPTVPRVPV